MNDKQLEAVAVVISALLAIGTENLSQEDQNRIDNSVIILRDLSLFEVENDKS